MLRRGSALVVSAVLLVSCSTTEGTPQPAADSPVQGGTLVAAISADPGQLNPAITTSGDVHTASELMYNGLVSLTPDREPVGELAESWDVEDNGALYRFHLREGVTWHDGEPFTSADVKFSFEKVLLKYHSRTAASVGQALESISTPDERTVEFRFKEPYAPFPLQLDVTEAPIIPEHIYAGTDPLENPANLEPVGTGPFAFESYKPGAEIRLVRNPDYFIDGQPLLDEVVLRVIPDAESQVIALEAGEVDWLFGVPGADLARLEEDGGFEFLRTNVNPGGSNCIMTVSFNLEKPVFQDVRTRRAVATAINSQQFVDRVLFGQGKVAEAPISSGIDFAHADDLSGMPTYDKQAAEDLLDAAGWIRQGDGTRVAQGVQGIPDGTPLSFGFTLFTSFAAYGDLFKAQLADVGIDVELDPQEPDIFAETVFVDRDFDSNIISYCNGADPEIGVKRMYVSSTIGPVPFSNAAAYSNPMVDSLFDQARTTVDPGERGEVYRQIQEILVEDLPYFWVVETEATRVYSSRCGGFSQAGHFAEAAYCRQ